MVIQENYFQLIIFCHIKVFPQPACLGGSFWLVLRTWFSPEVARLPARLGGSFNIEKIGQKIGACKSGLSREVVAQERGAFGRDHCIIRIPLKKIIGVLKPLQQFLKNYHLPKISQEFLCLWSQTCNTVVPPKRAPLLSNHLSWKAAFAGTDFVSYLFYVKETSQTSRLILEGTLQTRCLKWEPLNVLKSTKNSLPNKPAEEKTLIWQKWFTENNSLEQPSYWFCFKSW